MHTKTDSFSYYCQPESFAVAHYLVRFWVSSLALALQKINFQKRRVAKKYDLRYTLKTKENGAKPQTYKNWDKREYSPVNTDWQLECVCGSIYYSLLILSTSNRKKKSKDITITTITNKITTTTTGALVSKHVRGKQKK